MPSPTVFLVGQPQLWFQKHLGKDCHNFSRTRLEFVASTLLKRVILH